jgi:iron complex outermembrane receptor protein/hemoglobin/transferrin/lactoferrin receptor protein
MPYPMVPAFEADGRTQRGTGFREGTFDARLVARVRPTLRAVAAVYGYREFDAPRTDLCPPPYAPAEDCLRLDEQFRTLAYVALRGDAGPELRNVDLILSYARHHERRTLDRPRSAVELIGRDNVDTLGVTARATSRAHPLTEGVRLRVRGGFDGYRDDVASAAWTTFTDVDITLQQSRGQYMDGATYLSAGAWTELEALVGERLAMRAGGRANAIGARAGGDPESGTAPVSREWTAVVGRAGVEARVHDALTLIANVDEGFRAPNLDDLTSRQQTGPGFQFENDALEPERSLTFEAGARSSIADVLDAEAWAFHTRIDGAIIRSFRSAAECPPETPACASSWSRFQLVNSPGTARIFVTEAGVTAYLPLDLTARATFAWTWGDAPNPLPNDGSATWTQRVPLSRIPPMNGTAELRWRHVDTGVWAGAALRWAHTQDRLAPTDRNDARIPLGGTPGYSVVDLRAGWRWGTHVVASLVFENIFDAAYRVHGSSVNGPGRGAAIQVTGGL